MQCAFMYVSMFVNQYSVYEYIFSFIVFSWMLLIMSVAWLFLVLSWLPYDGFLYVHILVNAAQAPLLLYVCVLRQKHVTFLLKKSCCYNEPPSANDWGDEMHYMNCNNYWDEARVKNAPMTRNMQQTVSTVTPQTPCIFPDGLTIGPVTVYRQTSV